MGWPELHAVARAHHGIVTIADAINHGVSEGALRRRAVKDGWTLLHPGVWLVAGAPSTDAARLFAATVAFDAHAGVESALWLHGLRPDAPRSPQLVVVHRRHGSRAGRVEIRRTRTLLPEDVTTVSGTRTTAVARTLIDIAPRRTARRLRGHVIDAERLGLLDRERFADRVHRLPRGVPARGRLREVIADLGSLRSDSDTEHDVRRTLLELGYPVHSEPFPYRCDDGIVVNLDLALPDHWVYLELDGFVTHTERRVFETDRIKWTQVVRQWRPVWVTADRWRRDRDSVLADLDAAIAAADPRRPPAVRHR